MTHEQMWSRYQQQNPQATDYQAWAFCGGGPFADELGALVLQGTKAATASTVLAYQTENEPLPTVGCYSVVLSSLGDAMCVIRDTKVTVCPFDEVSERHAWLEGEGDRSLASWREVHHRFFKMDYDAAGLPYDENGLCVLEEFEIVYR